METDEARASSFHLHSRPRVWPLYVKRGGHMRSTAGGSMDPT